MTGDQIRELFLRFFEEQDHKIVPSSSLVPAGDPTLLFTTAGMVQMKPYFLGQATPPRNRMTSCQKCFRTTDVDSVGDSKHLTFFEMLGNFSVGDYFKKEAIAWAWEFVTQRLKLPKERLWITVYLDDNEAAGIWSGIGVPADRIVRQGEKDNFWGPAGDSGPCGPCSEIHLDFGAERGCGRPDCGPCCDCGRFIEVWNLVFMQYNQDKQGNRTPLPRPNIDTGMGLERITAVVQGKDSVYQTEIFTGLLDRIAEVSGKQYGHDAAADRAMRIVAEHSRGISFLIAGGVTPGNDGRSYVLRRLLRRASLFGRKLGLERPFLRDVAEAVVERMGKAYPELAASRDLVLGVIETEEERFQSTLGTGLQGLTDLIAIKEDFRQRLQTSWKDILAGFKAQRLLGRRQEFIDLCLSRAEWLEPLDTRVEQEAAATAAPRGLLASRLSDSLKAWRASLLSALREMEQDAEVLPEDIMDLLNKYVSVEAGDTSQVSGVVLDEPAVQLRVVSGEEAFILYDTYGFPLDLTREIAAEKGFGVDEQAFEEQMERQRQRARAASRFSNVEAADYTKLVLPPTMFVGYDTTASPGRVTHLTANGASADAAEAGQLVEVVLDRTPFYGEMGGQVGDAGKLAGPHGVVQVEDTVWVRADLVGHRGRVAEGTISVGETVQAEVDTERRADIARNHTATHLLQAALRRVLGSHVQQKGSLVAPDRLRFDFSHTKAVSPQEMAAVQAIVNDAVRRDLGVRCRQMTYARAMEEGATALFGEKYGEQVRMVTVGDPPSRFSAELCGGTHTGATGQIGMFLATSETSVGAGLRRIEGVTGKWAEKLVASYQSALKEAAEHLRSAPEEVPQKIAALMAELDEERKRYATLERESSRRAAESLVSQAQNVDGVRVLSARVSVSTAAGLREMGDVLKSRMGSGVITLGAVVEDRPLFLVMVTPDLVSRGIRAGDIARQVAQVAGGGGGGKPDMAQAGGKDKSKLDEALALVNELIGKGPQRK